MLLTLLDPVLSAVQTEIFMRQACGWVEEGKNTFSFVHNQCFLLPQHIWLYEIGNHEDMLKNILRILSDCNPMLPLTPISSWIIIRKVHISYIIGKLNDCM